jgi:diacylglycerol kinase (CTP)
MDQPVKLQSKADLHLARKLWHFFGVVFIAVLFHNLPRTTSLQLITFFTTLVLSIDISRRHWPPLNRIVIMVFKPFMRDREVNGISGNSSLLLGSMVIIFLFPKVIVTLTLLLLAVADPTASYFGVLYGKDKLLRGKSLQGTFAAFFVCTVISGMFYLFNDVMTERLFIVALLSGMIGAISELLPIKRWDDNFTFPVLCAIGLQGVFYVFGGF